MYFRPFPWFIKGKAWYPSEVFFKLSSGHTHSQVLKPPLPSSEQSCLERMLHAHQRLGTSVPLSIVCNPYCKSNTELVAQAAMN
jgi:hypothetical protein